MPLQAIRQIHLCENRVDFRKHFNGLLGEAYKLGLDPYRGDCVVFLKKDHTQLRAIVGDALGQFLIYRRFDGGSLRTHFSFVTDPKVKTITQGELLLLLEGSSFTVHKRVRPWRK